MAEQAHLGRPERGLRVVVAEDLDSSPALCGDEAGVMPVAQALAVGDAARTLAGENGWL